LAGLPGEQADQVGLTAPGGARSWKLVVLSAPQAPSALARTADLFLALPFDPGTFAAQVVATVEGR
ncbi:MAG TPA: hypothetical protein VG712_02475, partial [Gemmatimonadales bacterium]|nr:hypothetical protein [Gemmatimonadales bacterium]